MPTTRCATEVLAIRRPVGRMCPATPAGVGMGRRRIRRCERRFSRAAFRQAGTTPAHGRRALLRLVACREIGRGVADYRPVRVPVVDDDVRVTGCPCVHASSDSEWLTSLSRCTSAITLMFTRRVPPSTSAFSPLAITTIVEPIACRCGGTASLGFGVMGRQRQARPRACSACARWSTRARWELGQATATRRGLCRLTHARPRRLSRSALPAHGRLPQDQTRRALPSALTPPRHRRDQPGCLLHRPAL